MSDDFSRVKDAINLADYIGRYAPLKRAGQWMTCNCPLPGHDDKTPSFQVKEDRWICRGKCGIGGDIFDFVEHMHGWTLQESLIELARYAGVTLEPLSPEHKAKQDKRERLYALMAWAANEYHNLLKSDAGRYARTYLTSKRGLLWQTLESANIGYALDKWNYLSEQLSLDYSQDELLSSGLSKRGDDGKLYDTFRNRIMIPIRDHKGRIVAFTGRAMGQDQQPKYLHNATIEGVFEKSKIIHRMPTNQSTKAIGAFSELVIVEGSLDPISGANRGIYNIASLLGKSMTDEQFALLCQSGVERLVFCLDNDQAGHEALKRLVVKHMHAATDKGIDLYAMCAPFGKDPDDTFREKPELWQPAVDSACPVVDVLLECESASLPKDPTPGQKQVWGVKLLPLLKGANGFVNEDNIKRLASFLGSSIETIEGWTRTQQAPFTVLKGDARAVPQYPNLPSLELKVLHGILVNEDPQRWIDRANIVLRKMPYEKACKPLDADDFTSKPTRDLMLIILEMAKRERPFDGLVAAHIGNGPLHEVYYRATCAPEVQAVFASHDARPPFVQTHDDFLRDVYQLRALRLKVDITHKRIPGTDLVEWTKARMYLEQLARIGWVLI